MQSRYCYLCITEEGPEHRKAGKFAPGGGSEVLTPCCGTPDSANHHGDIKISNLEPKGRVRIGTP